jgi:hypothetical protein
MRVLCVGVWVCGWVGGWVGEHVPDERAYAMFGMFMQ